MLTMVTTVVILVISSNVVLSLGMVGALSIVRFRTAIKEPTDTAFLFWGIATITAAFEGKTNFWLFQFYCPARDLQEHQPEIDMILSGITPDKK